MGKIKLELQKFKNDTNILQKLFIIIVRIMMIYGIVNVEDNIKRNLMILNFVGTFTCEIVHLFSRKKSFLNQISYKVNVHTCFFVLMGSFFGHYISLYPYIDKYDWILHTFAGASAVFVGYYFILPLLHVRDKRDCVLMSLFGFLFSNFGLAFWEITEFWSDFVLGSQNQAYSWIPHEDLWFIEVFGFGENFKHQYPLFDTMIDMSLAFVAAIVASFALYFYLNRNFKKYRKTQESEKKRLIFDK